MLFSESLLLEGTSTHVMKLVLCPVVESVPARVQRDSGVSTNVRAQWQRAKGSPAGLRTSSGQNLVHRAPVHAAGGLLAVLLGKQVDHGHFTEQLLGQGVVQRVAVAVPSGAFEVEAADVDAVVRPRRDCLLATCRQR